MSWWDIVKMSDAIKWIIDHLDNNIVIELSGSSDGDVIDIILEIPINPEFLEWAKDKYKIDHLEKISNLPPKHRYKIEAIGE
jgi:hypothetical protein